MSRDFDSTHPGTDPSHSPARPGCEPWDLLTRELRACKETQQRAWGDLDDTVLGRYLAGEASGDEQSQVESALEELPELRKLTDIVRDVLGDLEPIVFEPVSTPAADQPRLLSLAEARSSRRPSSFLGQRSALMAAACLLVFLGVAMPRPGILSAPRSDETMVMSSGFASRGSLATLGERDQRLSLAAVHAPAAPEPTPAPIAPMPLGAPAVLDPLVTASRSGPVAVASLAKTSDKDLTPQQAVDLHRQGIYFRYRGELTQAEPSLCRAHDYCNKKLGPDHPATKWSVRHLAGVYEAALNNPYLPAQATTPSAYSPYFAPGSRTNPDLGLKAAATNAQVSAQQLHLRLSCQPVQEIRASVVPVLTHALRVAPGMDERLALIRALGQLGPVARAAVPGLTERLAQTNDAAEVRELLLTLDQMGGAARAARPVLARLSRPEVTRSLPVNRDRSEEAVRRRKMTLDPTDRDLADRLTRQLDGIEGRVGIHDEAGCFTLRAFREATQKVRALARHRGIEIVIETRCDAKGSQSSTVALERPGIRAVHVVIDPCSATVQVKLSEDLRRAGVVAERLREPILVQCRQKQFDKALSLGVQMISRIATGDQPDKVGK